METTVFEIELMDGRIFRVFCENSTQKKKVIESYYNCVVMVKSIKELTNGIHTTKQWLKIKDNL